MDDSTVTITTPSISRHDTVTPLSETHTVEPHNAQPFNILYAGSASIKSTVLRKLGQSLMAATLKGKSPQDTPPSLSASASFITDWSSGCTSVVPITDFDTSDVAPEVEFVEDSLVKMRVQDIDTLHGFAGRRASHFLCQLDQSTRVVSCHHYRHQRRTVCPWFENPDTCPSLVVYCSSGREEKTDVGLQKIEAFAEDHHFPLLVISDCERSGKLYCFNWNEGNVPIPEAGGRAVMLGYESLTFKKFLDLESAEFGRSLWKGAVISQDAIKNAGKTRRLFDFGTKTTGYRVAATVFLTLLVLLLNNSFFRKPEVITCSHSNGLAETPTMKDVETQFEVPSEVMSLPPPTVTITEQLTITIPIVHTKTKTVTTSPTASQKATRTSTIILHPIYASVNVPRASLTPRLPGVDYGYAFGYDEENTRVYLETDHSVMLRLPASYRESTIGRPVVKLSVSRNGKPVHFEVREWKKNDLAFIEWSIEETHDTLSIFIWTEKAPFINEKVIIDYSESIIDPRLWEMLEKSHVAAWKEILKMRETLENMKTLAKDVTRHVSDQARYHAMEDKVGDYMRKVKNLQDEMRGAAERHYKDVKTKYPRMFTTPTLSDDDIKHLVDAKDQFQRQLDDYVHIAQREAVHLSEKVKDMFRPSSNRGSWNIVKTWCRPHHAQGKQLRAKTTCSQGNRWRKLNARWV